MQNILKRPMFRKGGLTQRQGYENGTLPDMPSADDITKYRILFKQNNPAPKDDRLLRYFARAAGQIGDKPQPGTTGLQRIINSMTGAPLEQLFSETDERRKYYQGLESLAFERAMSELDRKRNIQEADRLREQTKADKLDIMRKEYEYKNKYDIPSDIQIRNDVIADMERRGLQAYDENGIPTPDFQRELKFTRTGIYAIAEEEENRLNFPLSNIAGDKKDMEASIRINQLQRVKQMAADEAFDAGLEINTVDFYDPSVNPKNNTLYIAEEGVEILDPNDPANFMPDPNNPGKMIPNPNGAGNMITIPGSSYLLRRGPDIRIFDINFNEIPTD